MPFWSRNKNKMAEKQCCQVKIVQNHGHWWFFVKKWQFITTTPVLLHFYVVMNWSKIPKWQFWPNFCHQWPSKITDLVINHHTWQHWRKLLLIFNFETRLKSKSFRLNDYWPMLSHLCSQFWRIATHHPISSDSSWHWNSAVEPPTSQNSTGRLSCGWNG